MKVLNIRNTTIALIAGAGLMAAPLYADMHGNKDMGKGTPGGGAMMGGQGGGAMIGDQKGDMTQMSSMMHDMADTMMSMSGDIGKGGMNATRQKQMGDRMREMAMMMENMSGMMGKGMMLDAEQQQKMGDMRKQMDTMHMDSVKTPAKKTTPHSHQRDGK